MHELENSKKTETTRNGKDKKQKTNLNFTNKKEWDSLGLTIIS